MKNLRGIDASDLQVIVDRFKGRQRVDNIPTADIEKAFAEFTPVVPDQEVRNEVRRLIEAEQAKIMQSLCVRLGRKLDHEPKPRELEAALESVGLWPTRKRRLALFEMLRAQYAERWPLFAEFQIQKRLKVSANEQALWSALERTYDKSAIEVGSMLLRLFIIVTSTGKVELLDVPHLASSLTDNDLKMYAESLNFTMKKTRKTRV
jgi:hypothetical protein